MQQIYSFFHNPYLPIGITLVLLASLAVFYASSRRKNRSQRIDRFEELHLKIQEDIKFAIAPKFIEVSLGVNDLVDLAVEIWRIEQRLGKVSADLPENQRKGLENSLQKLKRYIAKYDIEIVDYTGQKFNEGLNLDILSVEKDSALSEPIIKETVEPTIICKGQVVRKAKIVLTNK